MGLVIFLALGLQVGMVALVLWIWYRIMVSAVKRGILEADQERARMLPPMPMDGYWQGGPR